MLLAIGFLMSSVSGQDSSWRFVRGNRFDGHSETTGLLEQWGPLGPPVRFNRELGTGYSGIVGDSSRLYTQYQTLTGQYVVCLDAKTGETVWEHRYGWPYQPASLYPGPRSTPTLQGDRVYFATPSGKVGVLNALDGRPVWQRDLAAEFNAPEVEFGYACSPLVLQEQVFLPVGGTDASMVALNAKTGETIWHAGNLPISYSSALPITWRGRTMLVGLFRNHVAVFDRTSGELLATHQLSRNYDEHSSWPIYREPHLWIASPFRQGCRCLELLPEDGHGVRLQLVYQKRAMSLDVASAVLVGEHVFGFDLRDVQAKVHRPSRGQFSCLDFSTGEVVWTNGTLGRRAFDEGTISREPGSPAGAIGHASVIAADNKLILLNDLGELIVGRAAATGFQEIGRSRVLGGDLVWTSPSLIGGAVVVRDHQQIVSIDLSADTTRSADLVFVDQLEVPEYLDLAAWLLGTEPKYAMTAPPAAWLVRWLAGLILFGWVVAPLVAWVATRIRSRRCSRSLVRWLQLLLGCTLLSIFGQFGSFFFSWPLALFALFDWVMAWMKPFRRAPEPVEDRSPPWIARLVLGSFLLGCLGYFWLCRRLSLAFEWTFLMGFPAALPWLWVAHRQRGESPSYDWRHWLWSLLAFLSFYAVGAGVILWRYPIGSTIN